MITLPVVVLTLEEATTIERLVKTSLTLADCQWCKASSADFMAPFATPNGTDIGISALFCPACGHHTFNVITLECLPAVIRAWRDDAHPAHPVIERFMLAALDGTAAAPPRKIASIFVEFDTWRGRPNYFNIISEDEWNKTSGTGVRSNTPIYKWALFPSLALAINQAVLGRRESPPVFDRDTLFGCPYCGAGAKKQEWRNFNEVLREADIFCVVCGKFVRGWDPS